MSRDNKFDVDLATLRMMDAIRRSGSVSAASRELGVSQPALSQRLQRSETRLGLALTARAGRGIKLTPAGEIVAQRAPVILDALADVSTELGRLVDASSGHVKLAAFESAAASLVPAVIDWARKAASGISVSYVEADPAAALSLVEAGEVDAAIVVAYSDAAAEFGHVVDRGIELTPLFVDEVLIALPSDHPLAGEPTLDLASLEDDEWIVCCPRCRDHLMAVCGGAGYTPTVAFEMHNQTAMLRLVASGLGIAMIPELALRANSAPRGGLAIRPCLPRITRQALLASDPRTANPSTRAVLNVIRSMSLWWRRPSEQGSAAEPRYGTPAPKAAS